MENASYETLFILTSFQEMGNNKDVYFCLALTCYLLIIFFNSGLIVFIYLEKTLHEPMYIFLSNLFLSALIGSSSFYIKFMIDLRVSIPVVSPSICFLQIFLMYTCVFGEITILTVMAYDRYIAINWPLQYTSIISITKIRNLIILSWTYPSSMVTIAIFLTARLSLCGNRINWLYCNNWEIVKLSCLETHVNNIYAYVFFFTFLIPFSFIIYSYIKILIVCWNNSRSHKKKAFQTCLPHLITLILFLSSILFEVIDSRLNSKRSTNSFSTIASLETVIIPPLLNPLIYGIILPGIRKRLICIFLCKDKKRTQKRLM
ncbi:olfactory receptor 1468-like [Erpetoichthys calabaricus]|uniref:olfactory receptor 1468-like n=1 Tax=Erpetoichthys calabaricus TaxID=27687 RepID=UPI002234854E|nr:olfactory receptor 1468-like [Erpetoichthys calabaricus]